MGNYERRTRTGWVLRHDVIPMLEVLPSDDVKEVILALSRYSLALVNDEPPPDFSTVESSLGQALCSMLAPRILSDSDNYKATCEKRSRRSSKGNLSKLEQTSADSSELKLPQDSLRRVREENIKESKGKEVEVEGKEKINEPNRNQADSKPNVAEKQKQQKRNSRSPLRLLAEQRVNERLDNASAMDVQREYKNLERAAELAKQYSLPDSPEVTAAVLDDALRVNWDLLENALKQASASNSRERLSVNFYRSFLQASSSGSGSSRKTML